MTEERQPKALEQGAPGDNGSVEEEEELGPATADSFLIRRDEDSNLLPVEVEAPGMGLIKAIPVSLGRSLEYESRVEGETIGEIAQNTDLAAEILNRHLVEPDLAAELGVDELTGELVETYFHEDSLVPLLLGINNASQSMRDQSDDSIGTDPGN